MARQAASTPAGLDRFLAKPLPPDVLAAKKEAVHRGRLLAHATCVANGIVPDTIATVYGNSSPLLLCIELLKREGQNFGGHGTVDRDCDEALKLLMERVRTHVAGTFGSLIADGASLKDAKAIAVLYSTHQRRVKQPVLLSVVFPDPLDESGDVATYDYAAAAADIKAAAATVGIDISKQCPCLMGDNVSFNNAVATELGIDRGRCMPHALSLVAKHATKHLPLFKELIQDASAVISAGGTSKRAAELRSPAFNLNPNRMKMYDNKFASSVDVALYRLENFAAVQRWHTTSALLPRPEEDDSDSDCGPDDTRRASRLSKSAATAYNHRFAKLCLSIVSELFRDLPAFVSELSADDLRKIRPDIIAALNTFYFMIREASTETGAKAVIESALIHSTGNDSEVTAALRRDALATFLQPVRDAAAAALEKYDRHITPMHFLLERRFVYDPRCRPPTKTIADLDVEFFGCLPGQHNLRIISQYQLYSSTWEPTEDSVCPVDYWTNKLSLWRDLATVALYWLECPTSSVAAERVFAIMRAAFTTRREGMSHVHLARELLFRVNRPLLEELLTETCDLVRTLSCSR